MQLHLTLLARLLAAACLGMALATTAPSASSPSSSSSNGFTTSIDVLSHVPFLPTTPSYPSDESSCTTTIVQPLTFFLCTSTLYAATTTAAVDCAGCAIEHVTARPGALKELGGVDAGDEKFVCTDEDTVTMDMSTWTVCAESSAAQ